MLIIKYDPIEGKVVPDGLVREWANGVIEDYQKHQERFENDENPIDIINIKIDSVITMNVEVGATIMIDAIRALVMKKELDYKKILYEFEEQIIRMDRYNNMSDYPKGFCDTHNDILVELLEEQSKKYKKAAKDRKDRIEHMSC